MVDFLIVTALWKEFVPLEKTFGAKALPKSARDLHRYYEAGIRTVDGNDYSLRLCCFHSKGAKATTAGMVDAITKWNPRHAVMCGIAATFPGDGRRAGTILVADTIIDASSWRVKTSRTEIDRCIYNCDGELVNAARELRGRGSSVDIGPVIAQNSLVRSAAFRNWLRDACAGSGGGRPKPIGIEMEGGGLAAAIETRVRAIQPGFLLVKGAVDFANYHKSDTSQKTAALAAARYVQRYLKSAPIASAPAGAAREVMGQEGLDGVLAIREKYTFEPQFWNGLLRDTRKRLDLAGHALNKWFEEPYKETFTSTLHRLAKDGKDVRLLVLKPDGQTQKCVSSAMGMGDHGYNQRIQRTLDFLQEIRRGLPRAHQARICVRLVDEKPLPYMFVRTDQSVVVSPYLARSGSKHNILILLKAGTKHAVAYAEDFSSLFQAAEKIK